VRWQNDKGVALVLTLLLMLAVSVVAASLMFVSQTETYASMNYRMMSQARYGAEAGVQRAVNYLVYSYAAPGGAGDPLGSYNTAVSPVTYNGNPVILSANSAVAANYPVGAVQTAFAAAAAGSLTAGDATVQYAPYATLVTMRQVNVYGGVPTTIQTWQITSDGTVSAGRIATVEVTATLDQEAVPAQMYAAFATGAACGALQFAGGTHTDSYDSSALVGGNPVITNTAGNIGTNGNLTDSGGAIINGTLSTPRVGVGNCSSGNIDAVTSSGGATSTGGVLELPAQVQLGTPAPPNPLPPTGNVDIHAPASYPGGQYADLNVNTGTTLQLTGGQYNVNSITLTGASELLIPNGAPQVVLNVAGAGQATPIDFSGGSVVNQNGWDPSKFQILYGGGGSVRLTGGAQTVGMVYAPNAAVSFSGGGNFYGAVVAGTLTDSGGVHIHFDRHLPSLFFTTGTQMLSSFNWKKY
jgi:hypothetical protein